ncbi:FhaA domain-containing protein [Arthrobacter sp. JSM 101049]|uniref:FhaA domain-containing protein n=1 Tax=Arthrobacter sp. JSM 101049 TaxID=929097 RepID=UPI0035663336
MGVVDNVERGLEKLVTSVFRGSGSAQVQPVEIASQLRNEMDNRTLTLSEGRTLAPNSFKIRLGNSDFERARQWGATLAEELCDVAVKHARSQQYTLQGPVTVSFNRDETIKAGSFTIDAAMEKAASAEAPAAPHPPTAPSRPPAGQQPVLDINGQRYALNADSVVLGRSADADIPLDDPGISRRHVEIIREGSRAWAVDLGSTNGSYVNGQRIQDREELFDGSIVAMGRTRITYRLVPQRTGGSA